MASLPPSSAPVGRPRLGPGNGRGNRSGAPVRDPTARRDGQAPEAVGARPYGARMTTVTRADVLGFRVRAQQLDRADGTLADTAVLDLGVQDTGPDGARWALAVRGLDVPADSPDLALTWTIRGAPHLYRRPDPPRGAAPPALALTWPTRGAPHLSRRADLPGVAAATAPFSEADAGKRIYDAAKPLKAAGIPIDTALDTVADAMRTAVRTPTVKGDLSGRLAELLPEPYHRYCRPCAAVHPHEQSFRIAALRAGLELRPGTSPPVLEPIPAFSPAEHVPEQLDVVRGYLRLFGPATPKLAAAYLDAPVRDVTDHWPSDVVEVTVDGEQRWVLTEDADRLTAGPATTTRLLGPFDPYLQLRDRSLLVADPASAKSLWPVLGRPGAVLVDGEVAGTWRPR